MGTVDVVGLAARHGFTPKQVRAALRLIADKQVGVWRDVPVPIREFITLPAYLDTPDEVYPVVMREMEAMTTGTYQEIVLTGAIGAAKTSIALWLTAYSLYQLSCMKDPHSSFGLTRSSEITIIFQSITKELAKGVDYQRFQSIIERAPYFRTHFPFDKDIKSELRFPNRIIVKPVAGTETAAIGQNVIGGIIDELNFFQVVDNSKRAHGSSTYDQAIAVYNSLARRRKSRFMQQGKLPGLLCLVSSKRYPGQFTDTKEAEAKTDPTIYVYNKRTWDIKPEQFTGEHFQIFIGDEFRQPRILDEGVAHAYDAHMVMDIPTEFRQDFERDIESALRDIAGVSTQAIHPFMPDAEAISSCFGKRESILTSTETDFQNISIGVHKDRLRDLGQYRFIHVDLSISGDSTGIACGYVPRFVSKDRGDGVETLPEVAIDFTLEVKPPPGGEILFHRIRDLIYKVRKLGIPIRWISFDSFQSVDSIQTLRQHGFITGQVSMDTSPTPYQVLKTAMYDSRVLLPEHPRLVRELRQLEYVAAIGKVDHPPQGSKDLADALAGVVYGLTMRREVWARHNVSTWALPRSLQEQMTKEEQRKSGVKEK